MVVWTATVPLFECVPSAQQLLLHAVFAQGQGSVAHPGAPLHSGGENGVLWTKVPVFRWVPSAQQEVLHAMLAQVDTGLRSPR